MTMDGDDMRRGRIFFRRNQYKIAAVCVLAAVLGLAGVYMLNGRMTKEQEQQQQKQQVAIEEPKEKEDNTVAKQTTEEKDAEEKKEQTAKVSTVIQPKKNVKKDTQTKTKTKTTTDTDVAKAESKEEQVQKTEPDETVETAAVSQASSTELHFDTQAGLLWPVEGSVILDYSMDQTVHFMTLDQYKYNPAVIIAGNVNDKVKAAANGKITDISTNEVTGCTVTMDLGDGYTAIYGQLKEVPYEPGAYLEAGNTIGFVNEPTKYYALEGSNLYFALEKDGAPVDPVEFFQ